MFQATENSEKSKPRVENESCTPQKSSSPTLSLTAIPLPTGEKPPVKSLSPHAVAPPGYLEFLQDEARMSSDEDIDEDC